MAQTLKRLTDAKVKSISKPGKYADGGGLYLKVRTSGSRSWQFTWRDGTRRPELGLGGYPAIGLAAAREVSERYRQEVAAGRDPRNLQEISESPTFATVVKVAIDDFKSEWSNEKHAYQWAQTLGPGYCRAILNKRVKDITKRDIEAVLRPVWLEKNQTATRLRGRIERVIGYAIARDWASAPNPARWKDNMKELLPAAPSEIQEHLPSMHYREVGAFYRELSFKNGLSAKALQFAILTAARSGETLRAKWSEFDFENDIWAVPADRMKNRKAHDVPLGPVAVALIKELYANRLSEKWVFAGRKPGTHLSNMVMVMLMRRMGRDDAVPHGFRSTLRDWAGDMTEHARETAEMTIAHTIGNKAEQAYRRMKALAKRRRLLADWEAFLLGNETSTEAFHIPIGMSPEEIERFIDTV